MPTAIDTATAVGYFRVSSPGQAGERHVSLESPAAALQDYCRTHRLNPMTTFTDIATGRKDDRKMVEQVTQQGIGNVVVLFHLDVEDLDDVGVVQSRGQVGLETQGHHVPGPTVPDAVDRTLAAGGYGLQNLVFS